MKNVKETILRRLRSPVVWLAVIAQAAVIIALFLPDLAAEVKTIGASVVEICTLFGVLNNPENRDGF